MNVNFNKMLETLIFQRSYGQYLYQIHISITINRLAKAGAALVITISSGKYRNCLGRSDDVPSCRRAV